MASNQRCDSHGWARYLALQLSVSATYTVQQYPFSLSLCSVRNVIAFSTNSYCMFGYKQAEWRHCMMHWKRMQRVTEEKLIWTYVMLKKKNHPTVISFLLNRNLVISTQKQILIFHTDKWLTDHAGSINRMVSESLQLQCKLSLSFAKSGEVIFA